MDKQKNKIVLEVKFNDKLQSIFLNDYRVGGCKWNDIDGGQEIKLVVNKEDLLHELGIIDAGYGDVKQAQQEVLERLKKEIEKSIKPTHNESQQMYDNALEDVILFIDKYIKEKCGE